MKTITIAPHTSTLFDFDRELIASLPASGPRYTSYPTADRFHDGFRQPEYVSVLENTLSGSLKPVSLYVHIPFCNVICYYCGCNKVITKDTSKADEYLTYLEKEMALLAPHLHGKHQLAQLHFGGGTPTFLSDAQLERVFRLIRQHFELLPDGEYSIEIDPRKVSRESVFKLGELGFNRMSVGIQDFDPKVQAAVNRIQTVEETREVIEAAREAGFKSISVDLIYGLPHQSVESIKPTLDTVLSLSPDRLALYHYAHLPHIFKPQRASTPTPCPAAKKNWTFCNTRCSCWTSAAMCLSAWTILPSPKTSWRLRCAKAFAAQFPRLFHLCRLRFGGDWREQHRQNWQHIQPKPARFKRLLRRFGRGQTARDARL